MQITKTKEITERQWSQINTLWDEEYPVKLNGRFPILFDGADWYNHYIMEDEHNNVIAWAVDFQKDNQIRFSIIVDTNHKGQGLGGMLIEKLKSENSEFYGWVIDHNDDLKSNGTTYHSPMPFYLKHGFEILPDIRIDSEMIRAVLIKWSSEGKS